MLRSLSHRPCASLSPSTRADDCRPSGASTATGLPSAALSAPVAMSAAAESHKRRRDDDGSQTATGAEPADKRVKTEGSADGAAAAAAATTGAATTGAAAASAAGTRKKRRWDTMEPAAGTAPTAAVTTPAAAPAAAAPASGAAPALTAAQKALALQKSIAERLAAAKVPKLAAATSAAGTGVKLEAAAALSAAGLAAPSAAPYHPSPSVIVKDESKSWLPLRLDHLGRQVDEQGRVVQMDRPTELKVNLKAREEAAAPQKHMPHAKIATTIIKEEGMSKFHGQRGHAEIRCRVHANAESGAMLIVLTLTVSLVRPSVLIRALRSSHARGQAGRAQAARFGAGAAWQVHPASGHHAHEAAGEGPGREQQGEGGRARGPRGRFHREERRAHAGRGMVGPEIARRPRCWLRQQAQPRPSDLVHLPPRCRGVPDGRAGPAAHARAAHQEGEEEDQEEK